MRGTRTQRFSAAILGAKAHWKMVGRLLLCELHRRRWGGVNGRGFAAAVVEPASKGS
jgi:hypothetical protein